jgi:transposase-like protein
VNPRSRRSSRRPGGFQPPCCPNPQCRFHTADRTWRFVRNGHHIRASDGRRFQDFRCCTCRRRFCSTTFSTTYWLRRRDLFCFIANLACEGAALRQIARVLATSHTTVARHLARLGRHCLLFHRNLLRPHNLAEPLIIDGFETFEYSQYFPFHANLAVGADSWFVYHFTDSPLRRKGAMTDAQRRRRAELEQRFGRPNPKAVEISTVALLEPLLEMLPPHRELLLHSDEHFAYRRALHRLHRRGKNVPEIVHRTTSSKQRRTQSNPLFPVNLADLLLRHGSANHRRETIAFSKRRQAAMERLAIFTVWRNCIKKRRENARPQSVAMWLGFVDRLLGWRQILRRRLFPAHTELPEPWGSYYWRKVKTVVLGSGQTTHRCCFAF